MLRFINLLSEKDPDLTPATVSPQPEPREDPSEDRCSSADHLEYDPVNLEAIRIFERLEEEEEEIKNGMKWMQAEGTKASKIYLSSIETKTRCTLIPDAEALRSAPTTLPQQRQEAWLFVAILFFFAFFYKARKW
ncbi:hypothetical protein PVAP13_2NG418100 [Panicum virgatum]|uniref:Uncharacterized protein n=1 Tax=Panicum virgatum TaxID=38727 RepID=A0A8T0VXB7_PANVG|nr:hypothetical protein PVAP13_2NG418100 [Panicum virgatum]